MQKLIFEVCDANHSGFREPVFLDSPQDLPFGMMQAIEDFMEAHEGEITTPIVITAREEDESNAPCFPFLEELKTSEPRAAA